MPIKARPVFILATFLFVVTQAFSDEQIIKHEGRVVKVVDGDSITLLVNNNSQLKIRLAEIDTPERGQPYWRVSRQTLADLVAGKAVMAIEIDIDRYHRIVAHVYVDGLWVNEELVKNGAAWVYPKYAYSEELFSAQEDARNKKIGIWGLSEKERIPPWEWRRMK